MRTPFHLIAFTCTLSITMLTNSALAQWQQATGVSGLNMQSLMSKGATVFSGGATGVYRSTSNAQSFTSSNSGNDATGPTRGFTSDRAYLYTCTSQGVFRSSNDGASWTAINTGLASTNIRAIEAKGTTLFAGGQIGTGVYRSTNLGASWTLLAGGLSSGRGGSK